MKSFLQTRPLLESIPEIKFVVSCGISVVPGGDEGRLLIA
jgi:hypothetical protein